MIDAAGAIYVIGGITTGVTYLNSVWASTDGGARAGLGRGYSGGRGALRVYSTSATQELQGHYRGTIGVL